VSSLADRARVELPIEGMTCASCAARIERKLNRLDGVEATVNYATERATVAFDAESVTPERIVEAVEAAGYHASLPSAAAPATDVDADPAAPWRTRLVVSVALTVPVLALAMFEALQFDGWQWLSLALATPVVLWGGWPFHRAALVNLRHGTATMAAIRSARRSVGWSIVALLFLGAGAPTCACPLLARRRLGDGELY
jgi:Cu+-exporting ATPase